MTVALLALVALLGPPPGSETYPWLAAWPAPMPATRPLVEHFSLPPGFAREPAAPGTFADWLRHLPVRQDRTNVLAYDGRPLARPSAAVVLLDVGTRDLQQCADSAIRLHAEYLWSRGAADHAAYHFTSGDLTTWKAWRAGERFKVRGARVERIKGAAGSSGHAGYRGWLREVFRYAGTQSLARDSVAVGDGAVKAGDFYVQPGSPGHAVVVLDVAAHPDGRRAALIGQGFMPAEDFHIVRDSHARVIDGVWFLLPDEAHPTLATPSWSPFRRTEARRFKMPKGLE